jgi:hypothetical protein
MFKLSEEARIAQVIERLSDTYPEVPPEQVTATVNAALAHFNAAPLRDYVPLLVERRVRNELITMQRRHDWVVIVGPPTTGVPIHRRDPVAV